LLAASLDKPLLNSPPSAQGGSPPFGTFVANQQRRVSIIIFVFADILTMLVSTPSK
jgi:hypothetical protein